MEEMVDLADQEARVPLQFPPPRLRARLYQTWTHQLLLERSSSLGWLSYQLKTPLPLCESKGPRLRPLVEFVVGGWEPLRIGVRDRPAVKCV